MKESPVALLFDLNNLHLGLASLLGATNLDLVALVKTVETILKGIAFRLQCSKVACELLEERNRRRAVQFAARGSLAATEWSVVMLENQINVSETILTYIFRPRVRAAPPAAFVLAEASSTPAFWPPSSRSS